MKKYIITLAFTVVGTLLTTSCSDSFLDEQVQSSLAPESLANPLGLNAAVVGLHQHFGVFHTTAAAPDQGWLSVWQAGTDIAWAANPVASEKPYYNYELLASTDAAASYSWTWAYKLIKNA